LALTLLLCAVAICGRGGENADEFRDIVAAQTAAYNAEDLPAFMATVHTDAPDRQLTVAVLRTVFAKWDTVLTLDKYQSVAASDGSAKCRVTVTLRRIRGSEDFRDVRQTAVHTFKKDAGRWKMYSTEVEENEYIKK